MPKLRYLRIGFDAPIYPSEIPYFRSAVIEKTERQSSLFHNHKSDTEVIYRYPLIQYKSLYKKASIVCLESGTDDIHYLLQQRSLDFRIGSRQTEFAIEHIDLHYHQVQTWDTTFGYGIVDWLALNQTTHRRYRELAPDPAAQLDLLTSILRGNILAFAKGINWWVEDKIQVEITELRRVKTLPLGKHGQHVLTFSLRFRTNVSLPDFVGLGKRVSVGFGVVKRVYDKRQNQFNAI